MIFPHCYKCNNWHFGSEKADKFCHKNVKKISSNCAVQKFKNLKNLAKIVGDSKTCSVFAVKHRNWKKNIKVMG